MKIENYDLLKNEVKENYMYSYCGMCTLEKMEKHFRDELPERHKKHKCFPLELDNHEENIYFMGFLDALLYLSRSNWLTLDHEQNEECYDGMIEDDEEDIEFMEQYEAHTKNIKAAIKDCIMSYELGAN